MYSRIAENQLSLRNRWAQTAIAAMYMLTLFALVFAFSASLDGLRTPQSNSDLQGWTSQALWFAFVVLVVVPTSPLIQAMIADFRFSPDGVQRMKLRQLEVEVEKAFEDARRRDRSFRLAKMTSVSKRIVELSNLGANADEALDEWGRFLALRSETPTLTDAQGEIEELLSILSAGAEFTAAESKRFRTAMAAVETVGREREPH